MATEFKLPDIGEGTAEGEIIKWLVAPGDTVAEDTPLVEVMTDKATVEIPSPGPGTVRELVAQEGDVVEVGAVILRFGAAAETVPEATDIEQEARAMARAELAAPPGAPAAEAGELGTEPSEPEPPAAADEAEPAATVRERAHTRRELDTPEPSAMSAPGVAHVLATPATRHLARELDVDLLAVSGSGRSGRVMKEDVRAFAATVAQPLSETRQEPISSAPEATTAPVDTLGPGPQEPEELHTAPVPEPHEPVVAASPASPAEIVTDGGPGDDASASLEARIPFRGLRRRIAERMVQAKRTVPHFTYVEECDMTEVVELRRRAKEIGAPHGIKVTFLPFFVRALVEALRLHPIVNATLDEERGEIVIKNYYNVGIATATERGLIVPVIKNVERKGVFEIAREIERVAADARNGRSAVEDLQGGTVTISSTGNIGGVLATPIINHPEVAILGITAIRKRPVVRDGQIVVRDMVNLSLSLDHRVVDGADGALFMRDMIAFLEDPKLLVLGTP